MHVSAAFGVIVGMSNISRTGITCWNICTAVFLNKEANLRTLVSSPYIFTDWSREREKVISSRFDFQAGGGGGVEIESAWVQIGA